MPHIQSTCDDVFVQDPDIVFVQDPDIVPMHALPFAGWLLLAAVHGRVADDYTFVLMYSKHQHVLFHVL
jgi:hypothetical protein